MFHEPAHSLLELLGGPSPVARHLGKAPATTLRWRYDPTKGGTGGTIPKKYHDPLIELARQRGLDLPRGAFSDPQLAQELLRRHRESEADAA